MKKSLTIFYCLFTTILHCQFWSYDFGTGSGTYNTASSFSTVFLPTPSSGTSRVRLGSQGGSFNLDNPGLSSFGSNTELRITAPTGGSVNKFSLYNYSNPTSTFYTKFSLLLGDNSGSGTASSGTFYFFQGDGASFEDNNAFTGAQCFTGLRMVFGSSGGIATNIRSGSSWTATGLSGTPFSQGGTFQVEIFGNNSANTVTYNGGTIAAYKWDLWINGVLVGDDLPKALLGNGANIDSWMFYGESSSGNVANLFVDDITYSNSICSYVSLNTSSKTGISEQCNDGNWTYYGDNIGKYFAIRKNGNTINASIDITVNGSSAPYTSSSTNGVNREHASFLMGRYWNVTCTGCTYSLGGGVDIRFFYDPAEISNAENSRDNDYNILKGVGGTNTSSLAVKNASLEWFKTNTGSFNPSGMVGNTFPATVTKLTGTTSTQNNVNYVEFIGLTSFSGGAGGYSYGPPNGGGSNSLPVTWAGFEAEKYDLFNKLIWYTASEQNSSHFEVEASTDGRNFKAISTFIPSIGNSSTLSTYSYEDLNPEADKYYRLKQIDKEGKHDYSKTIFVSRHNLPSSFKAEIYPSSMYNSDEVNINLLHKSTEESMIKLVDYTGKILSHIITEKSTEKLDLSHLNSGIYLVYIENGSDRIVKRILK